MKVFALAKTKREDFITA